MVVKPYQNKGFSQEKGAILIFGCALILFALVFGTLGAFTLSIRTQQHSLDAVLGAAAEGIAKDLRDRLQTVIDGNGGNLPPSYDVSTDLANAVAVGNTIMSTSFTNSRVFIDATAPSLTVTSGDWDLDNSPSCNPNCFTVTSDGDDVNSVRVEATFLIGPRRYFGESAGYFFNVSKKISVVVYFDQDMDTAGVVERT